MIGNSSTSTMQHGISARTLAKSVARPSAMPLAPPYLDHPPGARAATSVIGAVLDLIAEHEAQECHGDRGGGFGYD
jgi:hypothetical protein